MPARAVFHRRASWRWLSSAGMAHKTSGGEGVAGAIAGGHSSTPELAWVRCHHGIKSKLSMRPVWVREVINQL